MWYNFKVMRSEAMNKHTIEWLKEKYDLDFYRDVLFKEDRHFKFLFDMSEDPTDVHLISGDPTFLGFEAASSIPFTTIRKHIETNNALAEVQGRKTFIEDFIRQLNKIETSEILSLPFKTNRQTYWLQMTFHVITKKAGRPALLYGSTNRIYDYTPKSILYYKRTHQDALTKLFTRETLKKHLNEPEHSEKAYGLYIDLDGFKRVNDTYGHQEGDVFLKSLAQVFIGEWEHNVIYYRLGGDEFFVYLYDFEEFDAVMKAREIIGKIEGVGNAKGFEISASVGLVPICETLDYHGLLNRSDMAMYASKERGSGNITLLKKHETIVSDYSDQFKKISKREIEKAYQIKFQSLKRSDL